MGQRCPVGVGLHPLEAVEQDGVIGGRRGLLEDGALVRLGHAAGEIVDKAGVLLRGVLISTFAERGTGHINDHVVTAHVKVVLRFHLMCSQDWLVMAR